MGIDRADDDDAPLVRADERQDRVPVPERPDGRTPEERDRGSYADQLRAHDRRLDAAADAEVDRGCARIREIEEKILTPAMLRIEAADPERQLAGLDCRLKGEDRLKEKVAENLWSAPGATAEQVLRSVPDAVRFTFVYATDSYSDGVRADISRLTARGFAGVTPFKNTWESDQYKGINTRWCEPSTGQLFEVQFHTKESYEAKQLTHGLYERQRDRATMDAERNELEDRQRRIFATIPLPSGASKIRDFQGERDG